MAKLLTLDKKRKVFFVLFSLNRNFALKNWHMCHKFVI